MKTLLSALAAVMLIGAVVTATPAQAQCWFNGYTWQCSSYYPYRYYHRHYYRPYWRHHYYYRHHW